MPLDPPLLAELRQLEGCHVVILIDSGLGTISTQYGKLSLEVLNREPEPDMLRLGLGLDSQAFLHAQPTPKWEITHRPRGVWIQQGDITIRVERHTRRRGSPG